MQSRALRDLGQLQTPALELNDFLVEGGRSFQEMIPELAALRDLAGPRQARRGWSLDGVSLSVRSSLRARLCFW